MEPVVPSTSASLWYTFLGWQMSGKLIHSISFRPGLGLLPHLLNCNGDCDTPRSWRVMKCGDKTGDNNNPVNLTVTGKFTCYCKSTASGHSTKYRTMQGINLCGWSRIEFREETGLEGHQYLHRESQNVFTWTISWRGGPAWARESSHLWFIMPYDQKK